MKKRLLVITGIACLFVLGWFLGFVHGQATESKVVFSSSETATFKKMAPDISTALISGDDTKGAYARFTKFEPGYDAGMHYHSHDIILVGVKGAYLYKDEDGEKRVSPGTFLRIPGGKKHWSGGDKKEGAVFYEESTGSFDLIPVK